MIGKNKIKLIRSLEYKKFRNSHNLFVAEGNKLVSELLRSRIEVATLIGTNRFLGAAGLPEGYPAEIIETDMDEIRKASLLKNPQEAIALCRIPEYNMDSADPSANWVIGLDDLQDPGNLGTIVRIADWFGITDIICSPGTADIFNPKAIQATMGSICRVRVHYADLYSFIDQCSKKEIFTAGAFTSGENLYTADLPSSGIIIMGNEGHGINRGIESLLDRKLTIPSFSSGEGAESLNAAVATALLCAEARRRELQ